MITRSRYGNSRVIAATSSRPQPKPRRRSRVKTNSYVAYGKRAFDVLFSLSVLILFSPVYLLIGFLISATSSGPILYVQKRVGRNGRPFGCIKFRTMVNGAEQLLDDMLRDDCGTRAEFEDSFKLKHDPRVTRIGKWLRTTSLDEFPQFWNVLRGDMSVVGPRPWLKKSCLNMAVRSTRF
jgi:lipopolysaccharide/colanic/teichoic acid biosynthesis glycosyltransferase